MAEKVVKIIIVVNEGEEDQRIDHIDTVGRQLFFFAGHFAVRLMNHGAEVQFVGDKLPKDFRVYTGFTPNSANPAKYLNSTPIGQIITKFAVVARGEEPFVDEDIRIILVYEEEK